MKEHSNSFRESLYRRILQKRTIEGGHEMINNIKDNIGNWMDTRLYTNSLDEKMSTGFEETGRGGYPTGSDGCDLVSSKRIL